VSDSEVTKRLNEIFANDDLAQEQSRGASELDAVGTDWSTERWDPPGTAHKSRIKDVKDDKDIKDKKEGCRPWLPRP
jgi:hypothetical protein